MTEQVYINKARAFEILRKKGIVRAEVEFSGGHDEGSVDDIRLFNEAGDESGLEIWYPNYRFNGKEHIVEPPSNEDEELSGILQEPVDEVFGSWASVESTSGVVVWDVTASSVKMNYTQDEPADHEMEF